MPRPPNQPPTVRPLAPAGGPLRPPAGDAGVPQEAASTESERSRDAGRKNASIACEACKISRRKCDRNQPCYNCANSHKDCVYDPLQDGRRREVRKRRLDELEQRSQALDKLLATLKRSSNSEAGQLLGLIKRDAPLDEILEFLDAHPGPEANETRAALSASPQPDEGRGIRRMLAISELVDRPPLTVPAAPWTKVTNDDTFVSHLVSTYLNWYHFYYHNFDDTLFLTAMAAGDLTSAYCSPFLVNAVLGMGCMFTDHPSAFATPGDPMTRALHFYHEAHRLWTLEAARPTLTNIQGFTIMIMLQVPHPVVDSPAALTGKDRVSVASLKQLEFMVPQLLRQHKATTQGPLLSRDFQRSLQIVEWAAHFSSCGFGTGMLVAPTIPKPSLPAPYAEDASHGKTVPWDAYPLLRAPISLPLRALHHDLCDLYLLASDIQSLVFSDFPSMDAVTKFDAAKEMERRVRRWYDGLPSEFQADHPGFIVAPTTVDLAFTMDYYLLVLWTWTSPPARHDNSRPGPDDSSDPRSREPGVEQPEEIRRTCVAKCFQKTERIVRLYDVFESSFGTTPFSVLMPQSGILAASFLLSENLTSPQAEDSLRRIMRTLVRCARRWQLVKGVTQMLLKTAEEKVEVERPTEDAGRAQILDERGGDGDSDGDADAGAGADAKGVDAARPGPARGMVRRALFEELQVIVKDLAWHQSDHLSFSSSYPNYATATEESAKELSHLLDNWAALGGDEDDHGWG